MQLNHYLMLFLGLLTQNALAHIIPHAEQQQIPIYEPADATSTLTVTATRTRYVVEVIPKTMTRTRGQAPEPTPFDDFARSLARVAASTCDPSACATCRWYYRCEGLECASCDVQTYCEC